MPAEHASQDNKSAGKMPRQAQPAVEGEVFDFPLFDPSAGGILRLQRLIGNQAVLRLLGTNLMDGAVPDVSDAAESAIESRRGNGQPLPESARDFFEPRFGQDFSQVQIHTGEEADTLNQALQARAFTTGSDIFFREGEYDPESSGGRELLAHELTHVVQQGGSATPGVQPKAVPDVQRGEAGVHQDIEMTSLGVTAPAPGTPASMSPEREAAMEVYVGNWMRDFSQAFTPVVMNTVSEIPTRPGDRGSTATIGAAGGEAVLTGLLRALASLEFGPEITDALVTGGEGGNIGAYRPEEHMDNPAGMSLGGDVVVRNEAGELVPADEVDRSTAERELAGSASLGPVASPQIENAGLYAVSGEGLAEHIYNTTESVKQRFIRAYNAGATPTGRMHYGTGLHGVEDYFSHSNFIEVALNMVLGDNPSLLPMSMPLSDQAGLTPGAENTRVDTLFDETVSVGGEERHAITTGTFGSLDTRVSIAHLLMPRLPGLFSAIDTAIERAWGLIQGESNTWEQIREILRSEPAGLALTYLLDGMEQGGMQLPVYIIEKYTIPDLPDMLPDPVEQFLEGRWIATGYQTEYRTPSQAFVGYQQLYQDIHAMSEAKDELINAVESLLVFPITVLLGPALVAKLRQWLTVMRQSFQTWMDQALQQLKGAVHQFLFDTIQSLTGIDIPEELRGNLEAVLELVHGQVEEMTHATSLESRMGAGGDLAGLTPEERERRIPEGALPPSHSEVSKDHPPHPADEDHSVHGPEGASPFFEIHRQLAIAADTHLHVLMEQAWQTSDTSAEMIPGSTRSMDEADLESRNVEAGARASASGALAAREGRRFAQAESIPEPVRPVLNAVDLYISHPADSTWWRSIIEGFVRANPQLVADDIARRNATRPSRT
jgi:hypothetical protein